jgi:hypothetical protein
MHSKNLVEFARFQNSLDDGIQPELFVLINFNLQWFFGQPVGLQSSPKKAHTKTHFRK